jgi:hypothetical protein
MYQRIFNCVRQFNLRVSHDTKPHFPVISLILRSRFAGRGTGIQGGSGPLRLLCIYYGASFTYKPTFTPRKS